MVNFQLNTTTRLGINSLLLLVAVMALYLGRVILIPTILALLLAAMLWPSAVWLQRNLRLPWGASCMVVIAGLIIINLVITGAVILAIPKILDALPPLRQTDYGEQLKGVYNPLRAKLLNVFPLDDDLFPHDDPEKSKPFMYVVESVTNFVPALLPQMGLTGIGYLWEWILILFILLFMMLEGRMLIHRIVDIFGPSSEAQSAARKVLSDMAHQVRNYLLWRTLINFGIAVVLGVVYKLCNLTLPWTWALLAAIFFYIPYLGPIMAGVPPFIDGFLSNDSPWIAVVILLIYLIVTIIEGYVIVPVVMGRSMELNATTVMLACLFWELVWGISGLFLAMPIMAAIKSICFHVPGWRPWANLMSVEEHGTVAAKHEIPLPVPAVSSDGVAKSAESDKTSGGKEK